MPQKTRFDIECENFDYFFATLLPTISPDAKDSLPKDVSFKLFRKGGEFNSTSTSKLNFISKLYILWKALRKRWWIVIEDEENGLSPEQFIEYKNALKRRDYGAARAEGLISSGTFILASKELGDAFSYLNRLSTSPAYNYLIKGKNKIPNKVEEWRRQMQYIVNFIICYDSNKKTWVAAHSLSVPEWYVLISLFHGREMNCSILYRETFKRAYQSSPRKIKGAFGTLQARGYIEKIGATKGTTLRITALGKDVVSSILEKYAINC